MDELYAEGTTVAVIKDGYLTRDYALHIGSEVVILEVDEDDDALPYLVKISAGLIHWVSSDEVGTLQVTYLGGE